MKKITKILLPLATVASTAAIAVPCITSCSRIGLMGTHDMLNSNYLHHVLPSSARTIVGEKTYVDEYFREAANYTDIIKDDLLFTYSKILTNNTLKGHLAFNFTRYFLYVDNIKFDTTEKTLSMHLWAEVTAEAKLVEKQKLTPDATGLAKDKYVKNFTGIIGAYIDTPYTFASVTKQWTDLDPFKQLYGILLNNLSDTTNIRVHANGMANMSESSDGSNAKWESLNIDLMANKGDTTGAISFYNDLVGGITKQSLIGDTETYSIAIPSYYFKNVKLIKGK